MEKNMIDIYCVNDDKHYSVPMGTTLDELAREVFPFPSIQEIRDTLPSIPDLKRYIPPTPGIGCGYIPSIRNLLPILTGLVDNRLKELDFQMMTPCKVEFLDYTDPNGRRTYIRSLCFVLQKAVHELFPDHTLIIDYALPSGLYCELRKTAEKSPDGKPGGIAKTEDGRQIILELTDKDLQSIRTKIQEIINRNLRIIKTKYTAEEAIKLFEANNQPAKAALTKSTGRYTVSIYYIEDENGNRTYDSFHGPLLPSTGCLWKFAISGFKDGFCLQYPMEGDTIKIAPMKKQAKIASTLKTHSDWCSIIGITGIGPLNRTIQDGNAVSLINLAETWQEQGYADIARKIYALRDKVKIVFIAGPSSSGKTSSSLRLSLHCKVLGLNPKVIELDNYFVDREHTPKDEKGNYDFEALGAMDLKLLNEQLNDLLCGQQVEIPKYNFKTGSREYNGNYLKLEEKDILIMEGIHALNPEMTPNVDNSRIFRVYASALTSLSIDENNNISTSDNRLLRRIVRDNRVRGITPEETLMRWNSVRRGENRNIFPFQENADAEFNSALIFELPVLKYYAEPLLKRINPTSPAYTEAVRLLKFLNYIMPLTPEEIAAIPPTSIMREFIGGQTL